MWNAEKNSCLSQTLFSVFFVIYKAKCFKDIVSLNSYKYPYIGASNIPILQMGKKINQERKKIWLNSHKYYCK